MNTKSSKILLLTFALYILPAPLFGANPQQRKLLMQQRLQQKHAKAPRLIINPLEQMLLEQGLAPELLEQEVKRISLFESKRQASAPSQGQAAVDSSAEQERSRWHAAFAVLATMKPATLTVTLTKIDQYGWNPFLDAVADAPVDVIATLKNFYDNADIDVTTLRIPDGKNALQVALQIDATGKPRSAVIKYLKDVIFGTKKKAAQQEKAFAVAEQGEAAATQEDEDFIRLLQAQTWGEEMPNEEELPAAKREQKKKKKNKKKKKLSEEKE
ncbi:MAG TPA: hypothetical protein VGT41_02255 [Candidatus Babeliales bacterium]|nr:hypothetical protein [Candidatus Babeliales bacterium]